jgi:putative transcriptional regulator
MQGSLPGQLRRPELKQLATGKLLVAARGLPDPNFAESIVLLADFSSEGAMGVIVNRQTDATLARIAPGLAPPGGRPTLLFFGGPVQVPGVLALVRAPRAPADTRHIFGDVYLVNTRKALEEMIGQGTEAARLRIYVGYAGWAADQLNAETARGSWHVLEGDSDVVFDRDPATAWERQVRRSEALQADRRKVPLADAPCTMLDARRTVIAETDSRRESRVAFSSLPLVPGPQPLATVNLHP